MPTNYAAWQVAAQQAPFEVKEAPYPDTVPPGWIAIKSRAVAINPVDVACQKRDVFKMKYPTIFGCDVAGEVVEVGEGVAHIVKGQRVIA
jgi:NADPH:quinone reductase-like Zn-dependent oxidoreductase